MAVYKTTEEQELVVQIHLELGSDPREHQANEQTRG